MDPTWLEKECIRKAAELWRTFDDNEKALVRIGIVPKERCLPAVKDLILRNDLSREEAYEMADVLAKAIRNQARIDGGMTA